MTADLSTLLRALDSDSREVLENVARFGKRHGHFELTPDHLLLLLLDDAQSKPVTRLRAAGVDPITWVRLLLGRVNGLETGNEGNPGFAAELVDWLAGCVDGDRDSPGEVGVGALFEHMLAQREALGFYDLPGIESLEAISPEDVIETDAPASTGGDDDGTMVMTAAEIDSAAQPAAEAQGEVNIAGYDIKELIGSGGMARVYRATHLGLEREVAIKIIDDSGALDDETAARFLREARIVAKLAHPNIIQVYDVSRSEQATYLTMEYVPGGELSALLDERLEASRIKQVLSQVLLALQRAHDEDFIHRDIKPANILFREDGSVVLTDFGLARPKQDDNELTIAGSILGTPKYMSPEQARGESLDHRSDLYSVGVLFYRMVEGELPFVGESAMGTAMKHIVEPVPALSLACGLQPFVDRAMAKDPAHRFQSADEMRDAMNALEFDDR